MRNELDSTFNLRRQYHVKKLQTITTPRKASATIKATSYSIAPHSRLRDNTNEPEKETKKNVFLS